MKDRGAALYRGTKEAFAKAGRAIETTEAVARGLASTEGQTAMMLYLEQKLIDTGDRVSERMIEIRQNARDKRDQAVDGMRERIRAVWGKVKERAIDPTVSRAKEIRNKVVERSGAGKAKALEWGKAFVNHVYRQGENFVNESRARVAEVSATWNEKVANRHESKGALKQSMAEVLSRQAAIANEKARNNHERAIQRRQAAQNLRGGRITPPAS